MELSTILGFVSGIIFIFLSMLIGASFDIGMLVKSFVDYPSVMITIGGTIAAILIGNPLSRIATALKSFGKIVFPTKTDPMEGIEKVISLANLARKESLLALEEATIGLEDKFLRKGIMLIVDGTDPDLVRNILDTEMSYIESRHNDAIGVWEYMAAQAPAWGMIGTLIGLALMLQNLSDVSTLGPKMAVALITTFYGSVIANFIANPVANKLKIYNKSEMLIKEVLIEGVLSIQAGENPRIIEEKLKAFLAPSFRKDNDESTEAEKAGGE